MAGTAWTADTEAPLTRLWIEEGRTFAEIAEAVTNAGHAVSRAAVSGRIRRLGLVGKQRRDGADAPSATRREKLAVLSTEVAKRRASNSSPKKAMTKSLKNNASDAELGESVKSEANLVQSDTPPPSAGEGVEQVHITPAHPAGAWPIAALREGQCRFACTGFTARPDEHRFCGEPVAWRKGKPTSWCGEHLRRVCGAPGRSAGGASVADVEAGRVSEDA